MSCLTVKIEKVSTPLEVIVGMVCSVGHLVNDFSKDFSKDFES